MVLWVLPGVIREHRAGVSPEHTQVWFKPPLIFNPPPQRLWNPMYILCKLIWLTSFSFFVLSNKESKREQSSLQPFLQTHGLSYIQWLQCSVLLRNKMHPICTLSLLYPISVEQLKITRRVLQHATSSFLQSWISIKYLPGFPNLFLLQLWKNLFAPNWFSSSLPIYISPLSSKAGKNIHPWLTQLLAEGEKKYWLIVWNLRPRCPIVVRCRGFLFVPLIMVLYPSRY